MLVLGSGPDNEGRAHLIFGDATRYAGVNPVAGLPTVVGPTDAGIGQYASLAGVDLDGDGLSDLVLGAPNPAYMNAHLAVLYGDTVRPAAPVDATTLPRIENPDGSPERYATSLSPAGDLDGDGYDDLAVGDPVFESVGGSSSGEVQVLGGGATRWTGAQDSDTVAIVTITSPESYANLGWDVLGGHDLNGDCADDLVVSMPGSAIPYPGAGRVGVLFGEGTLGVISFPDLDLELQTTVSGTSLGWKVAAGDVDGDGLQDLVIGGARWGVDEGRVWILSGADL